MGKDYWQWNKILKFKRDESHSNIFIQNHKILLKILVCSRSKYAGTLYNLKRVSAQNRRLRYCSGVS